jgi:ribosome-associated protein
VTRKGTEATLARLREEIEDRKGEDLKVLDLGGLSTITDFFIIVTANSTPHLKALAENTELNLKRDAMPVYRKAGSAASGWVILDYVDVVVHIMSDEMRRFYDLETLWSDAREVS